MSKLHHNLSEIRNLWVRILLQIRHSDWSRYSLWLSRVKSQGKLNKHHQKELSSVGRVLDCRVGGREYDSWNRTNTQGNNREKKVHHLPCKRLDLRVDQMTTKNGYPVSSRRN